MSAELPFPPSPITKLLNVNGRQLEVECEDGQAYILQADSRWPVGRGDVYLPTTPPPGHESTGWVASVATEAEAEELERSWACHPIRWTEWRSVLLSAIQESMRTSLRVPPAFPTPPQHPVARYPAGNVPEQSPITVAQAAGLLGLSISTVRRMLRVRPAPIRSGGRSRRHERWPDRDGLMEWAIAVRRAAEKGTPEEAAAKAPRTRGPLKRAQAEPVDFHALGRELGGTRKR